MPEGQRRGGSVPGTTLDSGAPQLSYHPARYFTYFEPLRPPIVEALVLPFDVPRQLPGTIWIVSHDEETRFDAEDVRIMTALGAFAAIAVRRLIDSGKTENREACY